MENNHFCNEKINIYQIIETANSSGNRITPP